MGGLATQRDAALSQFSPSVQRMLEPVLKLGRSGLEKSKTALAKHEGVKTGLVRFGGVIGGGWLGGWLRARFLDKSKKPLKLLGVPVGFLGAGLLRGIGYFLSGLWGSAFSSLGDGVAAGTLAVIGFEHGETARTGAEKSKGGGHSESKPETPSAKVQGAFPPNGQSLDLNSIRGVFATMKPANGDVSVAQAAASLRP